VSANNLTAQAFAGRPSAMHGNQNSIPRALGNNSVPEIPTRSDPQITAILGISSIGNRDFMGSFPNIEAENQFE
jgi:hypothetical protein